MERRGYGDACGTAHALELIGGRWAALVIRELMFGPRRFTDLRAGLPGISANILTQRLEELEAAGILIRRQLPPPARVWVYELTAWGYESEVVIQTLGRWATRSPGHDPTQPLSAASLMLSFRTMIDRKKAAAIDARVGFRLGDESFVGHLAGGMFAVARGDPAGADMLFTGDPTAIAAVVYGGAPLSLVAIDGNRALAKRFVTLFPLPEKAPVPPR